MQRTRVEEQEDGSCMMIMEVDAGPPGVIEIWRRKINKGSNRSNSIITLGELIRVNSDLVSGGDVTHTLVSPDGQNVIYRADQQENNVFELFTTPLEGGGPTYKINGQLVTNGDVSFDRTTNNSSCLLYTSDAADD